MPLGEGHGLRVATLGQLAKAGAWHLEMAHDRPDHMLVWITRGQGRALLDGARRGIGTHNALFIPAGSLMSLDPGRQGFGHVLLIPDGADFMLPQSVLHLRIREAPAHGELTSLFEAMTREQIDRRPMHESAAMSYAGLMLIWLQRQLIQSPPDPVRPSAGHRLMQRYAARISQRYATGETMSDHADALGVTPTHLTRVCKSQTGRTAAGLLTERIVHAARSLLIGTDAPAQDISRHLGFGSPAYFSRFVLHHTGQTPSALRRTARRAA